MLILIQNFSENILNISIFVTFVFFFPKKKFLLCSKHFGELLLCFAHNFLLRINDTPHMDAITDDHRHTLLCVALKLFPR